MAHVTLREIGSLGEPSLEIAGLRIWVHGRQFEDAMDYWDGNWLRVTACCQYPDAAVRAEGAIIHLGELAGLRADCQRSYASLEGTAKLECIEPNLAVTLQCDKLGHIQARIEITPDHLTQTHVFWDSLDQSYLPGIISQCDAIIETFPIRGSDGKGASDAI